MLHCKFRFVYIHVLDAYKNPHSLLTWPVLGFIDKKYDYSDIYLTHPLPTHYSPMTFGLTTGEYYIGTMFSFILEILLIAR